MNENVMKPLKTKLDIRKTPVILSTQERELQDFYRYTKPDVGKKEPTSKKVFISPLSPIEKVGPKWGS